MSDEFVWALVKDVKRVVCELHDHGADGWDAQLVRNGEFSASRRFDTRSQALAHADAMRTLSSRGAGGRSSPPEAARTIADIGSVPVGSPRAPDEHDLL